MTELERFDAPGGTLATITGGNLGAFKEWAQAISVSGLLPEALRGKPADVLITVFHGLDLGLKPMQAVNLIHVVKGRPTLSAEGSRAQLLRHGHDFRVVECTAEKAVVEGRRRGTTEWRQAEFTDAQRRKAKLTGANWEAYPEDMLLARATTRLCKRYFPDVIGGLDMLEDVLDRQEPEVRPTLGQVAAERAAERAEPEPEAVDAELVEDQAAAVADMEASFTAGPVEPDLFADADVEDPPEHWRSQA